MNKHQDKKRKQELGIFYTPAEVVDFIFDILNFWKNKEDEEVHRWQTRKPKAHYPSVIDPACGEGIFLKEAVSSGFTIPRYIWGVDIDSQVKERWVEINLLKSFGSKADLNFHFIHQNGLIPIPEKVIGHKNEGMNQYDAVVGNPPYGGVGLGEEQITFELIQQLTAYSVLPQNVRRNLPEEDIQPTLLENPDGQNNLVKINNRLRSFPIEVLFLERFIQLARPGGWIAIIIPDGILTNSNSHYVREFIFNKTKVKAIVSLSREAFKNVGTSAKTSILFLRKLKKDEKPEDSYPIFLASAEKIDKSIFETIVKSYEKFYNVGENHMNKSDLIQITKDQDGKEIVMVRVDKTMKELMSEKPSSRWGVEYWHPKFETILENLYRWQTSTLEELEGEEIVISGDHVRKSRGESKGYDLGFGIEYYETKGFLPTAYDSSKIKECSLNAYQRLKATAVRQNDILVSCAGVGGVGEARSCFISNVPTKQSCTGDVFIIRPKKLDPYFFFIFLNSQFGKLQILREQTGVGTVNINTSQVLKISIPNLPVKIISNIHKQYLEILKIHEKAIEMKKKGDVGGYRTNLETAERMLKDLIIKTEEVIRGERKNIV